MNELSTTNVKNNNFFGTQQVARPTSNALADAESQRAIAEVQAAVVMAKKFPRNQIDALDRILNACTRPTLAESALYSYAKGGTEITGPSIRLAEAVAQQWGNIQFGIREVEQRNGESTVEAFAWDIETNTREVKQFQVPHVRYTKSGTYKLNDPRDIYEMVANQGARRLRACILGVIPGDVIEEAVKQCEITLKTTSNVTPDDIKKMLEAFATFKVTKEQIEKRIQCRLDAIKPAQMAGLKKVYASLKDGFGSVSEFFEIEESGESEEQKPKSKTEATKEKLKAKKSASNHEEKEETINKETGEIIENEPEKKQRDVLKEAQDIATLGKEKLQAWLKSLGEREFRQVNYPKILEELNEMAKKADAEDLHNETIGNNGDSEEAFDPLA